MSNDQMTLHTNPFAAPIQTLGRVCAVMFHGLGGQLAAQPELFVGSQVEHTIGVANFNESLKGEGGEPRNACIEEGGLYFVRVYVPCGRFGFMGFAYCGGDGTPSLYLNGGAHDMMGVTRIDAKDFDTIEFNAGDGVSDHCTVTYLWIRAYHDGVPVADFPIDLPRWQVVGVKGGGFDELRIGAYASDWARNLAMSDGNERALQALAIDNVRYGTIGSSVRLSLTGDCPGVMTAEVSGATPGGRIAIIAGRCDGETIIPPAAPACAGTVLPIGAAQVVRIIRADDAGNARLTGELPAAACGRACVVALDVSSCVVSEPAAI